MYKSILKLPILATLSIAAFAQEAATTPPASGTTSSQGSQMLTGVLMDASCQEINSQKLNSSASSNPSSVTSGTTTAAVTDPSLPRSTVMPKTTAESSANSAATAASGISTSPASGPTKIEGSTPATEAVTAGKNTNPSTDVAQSATSATGTATRAVTEGEATAVAEPGSGTRSRLADNDATMIPTTVREKYRNCMVTPTTTSFALHSNGQLLMLDEASNSLVREQLSSNSALKAGMSDASGSPKFMSVSINGSSTGNQVTVTSIQK